VFCNIWSEPLAKLKPEEEVSTARAISLLRQAKELGVRIVDFTGGEPLLRQDLAVLLGEAKRLKLYTMFTTNGIIYPQWAEELVGKVDVLNFSLTAPTAKVHDKIRGVACFDKVMTSLKLARDLGERPIILFTLTNESGQYLGEMVKLAQDNSFLLKIQPEFAYFGNEGVWPEVFDQARRYFFERNVYINPAELLFFKKGNQVERPRCRAVEASVVISPDGKLILPCYHHPVKQVEIDRDLKEVYSSPQVQEMKKQQGRFPFCQDCRIVCYLTPSFFYRLDRYFILNLIWGMKYLYERKIRMRGKKSKAANQ